MKINLNLTMLSDAMGRYFQSLHDKALSRIVPATSADNSDALNGNSYASLETQALQTINDHSALRGNVHNLTPADVGGYSTAEVNDFVATRMPEGILPISSYGTPDFLPVGLAGTFEGATTITGPRDAGLFVEDDGTLIILRNGTNGSNRGVYYAYLRNAVVGNLRQAVRTNKKYRPAYFPAGWEAGYIINSSESVIMGRLQDANGTLGDYFISLTNGSYNDAKHTGALISPSTYQGARGTAFALGANIYLMIATAVNGGAPFGFLVYQVSKSAVAAGGTVSFTQITGITTAGFSGTVSGVNLIQLANVSVSDNPDVKPLVLSVGTFSARNVFHFEIPYVTVATDEATGMVRCKVIGRSYFANSFSSTRGYVSFSFTFNPATKTANLDNQNFTQATMTQQANNSIVATGTLYSNDEPSHGFPVAGNVFDTRVYSGGGWVFHMIQHALDNLALYRSQLPDFTTKFEALRVPRASVINYSGISLPPAFGSAVGSKLSGPIPLSDSRIIFFSQGRRRVGDTANTMAYTDLEGAPDAYTHKSIYNGSYLGYKPSANRDFINDVNAVDLNRLYIPVTEVSASGIVVSGTRYQEVYKLEGPLRINADFTTSGNCSITQAAVDDIKNKITTALLAVESGRTVSKLLVDIVIPQTSGVPPFAVCLVWYADRTIQNFVARLNITGGAGNGTVTQMTVHSLSPRVILTSAGVGINNYGYHMYQGPTVIYTVGSVCLIGHSSAYSFNSVGSGPQSNIRFKFNKTTGEFVFNSNLFAYATNVTHSSHSYFATPTLGLGVIYGIVGSGGANDEWTKLVFVPIAKTTEAEFDNWSLSGAAKSNYRVLVSQEVAQGWVLYFTEETSAVLNGKFYTLPPQNINLLNITATPANRTFYVHVQVVDGVAQYLVSLTRQVDTATLLYLGRVVTGATSITTIDVRKASRLENIQLVAAG